MGLLDRFSRPPTFDASTPDETLALAARNDPDAFALLYERHRTSIHAFVLARLGNPEDAEDVTSQVFAQALTAIPRYQKGSFRGWIYQIARNAIVDHQRSHYREVPFEPERHQNGDAPPDEAHLHRMHLRIALDAELARLPSRQRQIISLRLRGLSTAQIAAKLGITVGAVKSAQHRALTSLEALREDR